VLGGLWNPANVCRELGRARNALAWITSHTFRKTVAMILDEAALSAGRRRPLGAVQLTLEAASRGMARNSDKCGEGMGKEAGQAS
jgi:hypothetical protein